jgi:DNA-binding transcriptional ArsR family regulator
MANESAVELIQGTNEAQTLLHPLRLRLLEELREPESASGLSRRMRLPRQRLNYHLRALEKQGLVEPVEERRKGNCVERVVRASARYYLISPAALGSLTMEPGDVQDRFSATYLLALAAKTIRDLALLRKRAARAGKSLATFALQTEVRFRTPADRKAFSEELAKEVARLAAKYHDDRAEEGRKFHFFVGAYPAISKNGKERKGSRARKKRSARNENN